MDKALMPGISIVVVAIILDRLTQRLVKKRRRAAMKDENIIKV